ncbi:hypothetical protein I3843_13G058300 [Carya illinoinensis]|uniref:Small ribosomal subunit protein mS29 n=1 Tax=Carya illinoinensis TaxID=32201 RepID=A0A8T1NH00_CARIL|nr:hypothetical protein I3760_13G066300 [Carya illinoinensis]KAG6631116.1 hypothetical protein CIPAW_13G067700 [Carya illinoinensis]KAG6680926.1 hypothetical protein I3842_13G066600 [Carya illinoinensis]KAG7949362.1 hypothetical protein I3843_13G058300 [Carya illinoinensis]
MLRCVLRASAAATTRNYSSKNTKSGLAKSKKTNAKESSSYPTHWPRIPKSTPLSPMPRPALAADDKDQSLDVGPNGRHLFTITPSLSLLSRKDTCSHLKFCIEGLKTVLLEGLPTGMRKEFDDSLRPALLVRQSLLDLRDNFRRIVDPPLLFYDANDPKLKKQIILDAPASCGKSIALAMLVHWARDEEWTHGGFFSKNQQTGLWDTPLQAANDCRKWNESHLKQLPCQINDPIPLGEGAGVGWLKDVDNMAMPEGSTLCDLLSLVKNIPVLIAIDQYNSWFTFSEYEEAVTIRSSRPVHARELAMVNAFRSMVHDDMMVGAFSHSTEIGKLRKDLPDVPVDACVTFPRYSLDEATTVCHYYLRLLGHEVFSEENWKKVYYLSNGNGTEMRWLVPFMRQSA